VGRKAELFRPTTESFRAQLAEAERRAADHAERKRATEADWIRRTWPRVTGHPDSVRTERVAPGAGALPNGSPRRVRYTGTRVRYMGHVIGRDGPPLDITPFGSTSTGAPGLVETPEVFTFEPGTTRINPGLDTLIASMAPGERRIAIVPAPLAYGRAGFYAPDTPGRKRFVISPHTLLAYEVEVLQ
jgi:FKBP-type peptidyl-prolyl cis-trans isomerase